MRILISKVRKEKGLSQEMLARHLGLSRPYLSQLETGKRRLTRELHENIAKALSVKPADLVMSARPNRAEEILILEAYRSLTEKQKKVGYELQRIYCEPLGIKMKSTVRGLSKLAAAFYTCFEWAYFVWPFRYLAKASSVRCLCRCELFYRDGA